MTTANTTPSLGDILRNRIQAEKDNKHVRLEREARYAGEKAQRELRAVTKFFEDAKKRFSQNILDGDAIKPIQVGLRQNLMVERILQTFLTTQVNDPRHQYYPVWEDFAMWASSNGLQPIWEYAHDGGGVESWRLLSIEPK